MVAALKKYDVIIVGSGLAGASLALALAPCGLQIAIIDSQMPNAFKLETALKDQRSVALTYGSHKIFESLGLWEAIVDYATPIHQIHVSQKGTFGATRLKAAEAGVSALGYVTGIMHLNQVLQQQLDRSSVKQYYASEVVEVFKNESTMRLRVIHEQASFDVETKLIVAADGTHSSIRQLFHIPVQKKQYAEQAIVAQIGLAQAHKNIAYERFTAAGTIAFLPLDNKHCGLVWSVKEEAAAAYAELSDADFLDILQNTFGYRLGPFKTVSQRAMYPLNLQETEEQIRPRLVLLGNAAHTLHPVAAQGFNLSLRDVAVLAEELVNAYQANADLGAWQVLENYVGLREVDQKNTLRFTDALTAIWHNHNKLFNSVRAAALIVLDTQPFLKDFFMQHTMGLALPMAKLSRGIKLC